MTPGEVYNIVIDMPANDHPPTQITEPVRNQRRAFGLALASLVPPERRSMELVERLDDLSRGRTYCGSAAREAVRCGADPLVVVTTARLILS